MCNVKGGARSDKPTENYYPTLQFLSALGNVLASFSSLLWFYGPQLYCFNSVLPLLSTLFPFTTCSCFQQKSSDKPTVHYLPSNKQQTDKVSQ